MPADYFVAAVFATIIMVLIFVFICRLYEVPISELIPLLKPRQKKVSSISWGTYKPDQTKSPSDSPSEIDLPQTTLERRM